MAMNDFNIGFLAGLDGTKSKAKLNQDIDAIKKSLKELELKAKLDPNQVKALENQLNNLKVNLSNVSFDQASLNRLVSQINNSLQGIKLQIPNLNTGNVGTQAQQVGQQIGQQIQNGINSASRNGSSNKLLDNIKESIGINGKTTTQINTLTNSFKKLGLSSDEVISKMQGVTTEYNTLKNMLTSGASESDIVNQFKKMNSILTQTQNSLKQTRSEYSLLVTAQQRLALANTIESWNQKNTAATKEAIKANEQYIASLRDLNTQMTKMQYGNIQTAFKQTENQMRGMNRLGLALKDQWKQATQSFTMWLSASTAVMEIISKTCQAVTEIKEVDNILTEISKTSDITNQKLKELGQNSYNTASKYGRTATDYLSAMESMSRSGFYGDKGKGMAEQSLLAQSAGDMEQEIADKWILATNAAYKYEGEASKINEVLDGTNEITNRNSVNMTDMAEAMSTVGTSASQAGIKVNELASIIGTSVATTKKDGSEVGTAWKAILINLQNISSKKITSTLDKANASMTEMVNGAEQLRNPIAILKDLAKTYNSLDSKDPLKAEITQNIGGKHHANILSAYLTNIDQYNKMLTDYSEGSGSAMEEANKSANNLDGTLNKLSNSWTAFVNSIVNSDGLKIGANLLNGLVQGVTKLTSSLGSLGAIGLGAGLFAGFKNVGIFKTIEPTENNGLTDAKTVTWLQARKIAQDELNASILKEQASLETDKIALLQYEEACFHGAVTTEQFRQIMANASASAKKYAIETKGVAGSTDVFVNKQKESISAMQASAKATVGTGTALKTLGRTLVSMVAFTAIMEIIGLITNAIDNYIHRVEIAKEEMKQSQQEYQNAVDEIKNINSQLEENKQKIDELNSKEKLTYAEKGQLKELKEITEQLQLQKEIEKNKKEKKSKESAENAIDAYKKQYGKYGSLDKNIKEYSKYYDNQKVNLTNDENNIAGQIIALKEYQKLYKEAKKDNKKIDAQYYFDNQENIKDVLKDNISTLTEEKDAMQSLYDTAKKNKNNGKQLTSQEQDTIKYYEEISNTIDTINKVLNPDKFISNQIDKVFEKKGLEKTKDELIQIAKNGTLKDEDIKKYDNLNNELEKYKISAKDLAKEINAIAKSEIEQNDSKKNTSKKSLNKVFKSEWKSLDNTDDKDLKNTKNDLLELASAGELTAKTFKNVSGSDKFLEKLGLDPKSTGDIDVVCKKINNLVSSADQLNSMGGQISKISDLLANKKNGQVATYDDLSGFDATVKGLDSWEKFQSIMGSSKSTMEQCQKAANALATEYVNSNDFLTQLDNTNEDYYITQLKNMGVDNAEQVVKTALAQKIQLQSAEEEFLAEKKVESGNASYSLINATIAEIQEFAKEKGYTDETTNSLIALALKKQLATNKTLDFSGDLNSLSAFFTSIGVTSAALQELINLKNTMATQGTVTGGTSLAEYQLTKDHEKSLEEQVNEDANNILKKFNEKLNKTNKVKISPTGSSNYKNKSNSGSGNNAKQKAEVAEQILDGIEIKLKKVSDAASKAKDKIDKMLSFGSKRKQTLKAINETTTAIKANLKAAQSYEAYANKAATTASKKVTNTLTTTSNDLVEEAKKYVGVLSYVYGGTSLTNGADCSGFVQQIYKEYGINLPRTSQAQWSSGGGTKVSSKKDLQPGDLVFFKGSNGSMSSPGHVAIYAGNGQIVEEYKTGTKARMTSLDSKSGYVGAKRYSSVSNMSTSDDSSSTSTKSKKVSSKTLTSYKKFIREGGLNETDILSITNENLKNAVSAYQTYHDKATSAKDSVSSLIDTLKDLYETLANNPIEKAAEKVEKLGTKLDILNAKSENFTVNFNGNSLDKTNYKNNMDSVISNYQQQTQAYLEAKNTADKNLTESNKTITKTSKSLNKTSLKKSGLSSKDQKKLKSYIKSKKFIPESLLAKIKNQKLLDKVLDYNEVIIGNEYFKEAVETANNNYEKAQAENETNQRQKRKDYFDQIAEAYENQISLIEGQAQKLSNEIDLVEAKGATISANFYKGQIDIENRKKAIYESEISDLEQQASTIQVGSDEWYECQQKIIDVKGEIQDSTKSIVEMNNQVIELANTFRTKLKDAIGTVSDEYDFMVGLMGNKDMFNEKTGLITNEGLATLSSYLTGIEVNKKKAEIDKQNVENLKKAMQTGSLSVEGYDTPFNSLEQLEEAYGNAFKDYRDEITNTYEYESKVIDMMRDKYESELDALQELIDKKKESLQAEKDLYDYQKQLKESTKNIDTIQKQIISIQGDTSEEGMSRIQKLQKDLEDAQEDLIDTEREKALSDQEEMLDKLYDEYEETLKTEMQDQDALIRKGQMLVENNLTSIQNTLNSYKDKYGYDYETLDSVLNNNNSLVGGINTTCNAIQTHLQSIKDNADKKASEVVNEIVTALNGLSGNNNSTSNTSNTSTLTDLNGNPLPEQHLFTPDPQQTAQDEYKQQQHNLELLDKAIYFIQKNAKTYKHKPKSDVNKKIKANIGGGKWLSTANLQKLATIVEVTYNGADKNENLYKKLKSLGLQGFAKGGIVSKLNKIALDNGDDAFATVKQGEAIFTPEQSKVFVKDFVPNMESMIDASKYLTDIIPKITPNQSIGGNNIEASYNFNFENCTNANDIIRQIRDNKNVQNALMDVTINKSLGKGNLQINKYR